MLIGSVQINRTFKQIVNSQQRCRLDRIEDLCKDATKVIEYQAQP